MTAIVCGSAIIAVSSYRLNPISMFPSEPGESTISELNSKLPSIRHPRIHRREGWLGGDGARHIPNAGTVSEKKSSKKQRGDRKRKQAKATCFDIRGTGQQWACVG